MNCLNITRYQQYKYACIYSYMHVITILINCDIIMKINAHGVSVAPV